MPGTYPDDLEIMKGGEESMLKTASFDFLFSDEVDYCVGGDSSPASLRSVSFNELFGEEA